MHPFGTTAGVIRVNDAYTLLLLSVSPMAPARQWMSTRRLSTTTIATLTRIQPAPFGTLIPPGVVPISLHACCTFCQLSCQFAGDVGKMCNFVRNLNPLLVITSLPDCNQVFSGPFFGNLFKKIRVLPLKKCFFRPLKTCY